MYADLQKIDFNLFFIYYRLIMKSIRSKFVRNYIFKNLKFYRSSSLSQPLEGFKNNFIKSQSLQYT